MNQARAVAIIPVRGGSVGIPRKNARLLCGKPLLAYVVEASLAAGRIAATYVSTEDAELAEIARRCGAGVLPRPAELADGTTTLDEVIVQAAGALGDLGVEFDYVVTLQATCPLLRPETIDAVVARCVDEGLDTVTTAVAEAHLAWTRKPGGQFTPLYEKRVNRQFLEPRYRETGGVTICRRDVLATGTRFGLRVGIQELSKGESLDIDDHFDWWMAEKSLQRRRVLFHVVGERHTGLGHVARCLSLADRLIDHDLRFLTTTAHDLAVRAVSSRFYPIDQTPETDVLDAIDACGPDLVVNDMLDTSGDYMRALRDRGVATLNLEDLGEGSAVADVVVNAMYDQHPRGADVNAFHGIEYCVLRDEFLSAEAAIVRDEPADVLLLFGGTDPNDLTARCLGWIDSIPGPWRITAIVGLGYPHVDRLRDQARRAEHQVEVVQNVSVISKYMSRADLAFTSAGRTVFELASLGVPMVVIPQNAREETHVFARQSPGTIQLPRANLLSERDFREAAGQVLGSSLLRRAMHDSLAQVDVRGGIDRVLGLIEDLLVRTGGKRE